MRFASIALTFVLAAGLASGEVKTKTIEYQHEGEALEGYLAWDDAVPGPKPGILVVHEWWGLNDYARRRARDLAALGYVGFAVDMYGKGKVTEHPKEAGEWAKTITSNVEAWRARAHTGLEVLKAQEGVDPARLAAIGYCFGGATVLQLAYAGEDLAGVVSFHGSLPVASEEDGKRIQCPILVCHGASDAFIPDDRIAQFRNALEAAKADWQMAVYGGAVHSFTNPDADRMGVAGVKYDEDADRRSWADMQQFLDEVFEAEED